MKYKILIIILLGFVVTSCKKAITIKPENSSTFANGMDTKEELDAGINAMVYYTRNERSWNTLYPESRGYLADLVATGWWQDLINLEDNTGMTETIYNSYKIIAQANLILQAIDDVPLPKEMSDYYKGSVSFFKAFAYKMIVQRFGDCVLIKDEAIYTNVAKSPMCDLVEYAIEQAKLATELLPEYTNKVSQSLEESGASKGAANALLAELCLWQVGTKWFAPQDRKATIDEVELLGIAEQACTNIINSGVYAMESTIEDLCNKTLVDGGQACIFKSLFRGFLVDGNNLNRHSASSQAIINWPVREDFVPENIMYYVFQLSTDLIKGMYEVDDMRRTSFFYHLDNPVPEMLVTPGVADIAFQYKFRETRNSLMYGGDKMYQDLDQDLIIYRIAQIYLMRAEARAKLGKQGDALADINVVRSRAGASNINLVDYEGNAVLAVFHEFDRELIYEQGRYARVIRFGEEYVKRFLKGKFKTLSEDDARDGAFFQMIDGDAFKDNQLLRQNSYWLSRQ